MTTYAVDYVRYAWQMLNGSRGNCERSMAEKRQQDIAPYLDINKPLRVLDVANGRLRPQYALLKAADHNVYGIDYINRPSITKTNVAYKLARCLYNRQLRIPTESASPCTLACGDVGLQPFPSESFDLAVSAAAFEHFLDVPSVVAELYRVLKPGGVVWASIHLFTSPTGGHNVSFTQFPLRTLPKGVDAWDHLRKRRLSFHVPLNEWRKHQYLEAFALHFEVLNHYCAMREGEHLLTPEIAAELSAYSRDELTCGAFVIVARKAS